MTDRLCLRPIHQADAEFISSYAQDLEVTHYLSWRRHTDPAQAQEFVKDCVAAWRTGAAYPWLILQRDSDQPVGAIELRPGVHGIEFGYVLHRAFWGRGYMPEIILALKEWSLAQPQVFRFWAYCDVENAASARVLEKAGLCREGLLRRWATAPNLGPEPRDCYCYAAARASS